jgi:hypothetical protein
VVPLTATPLFTSKFYVMFNKQNVSQKWVERFSDELAAFKATEGFSALLKPFGLLVE